MPERVGEWDEGRRRGRVVGLDVVLREASNVGGSFDGEDGTPIVCVGPDSDGEE